MKHLAALLVPLIGIPTAMAEPEFINDRALEAMFCDAMGKFLDDGGALPGKELREQLDGRRKTAPIRLEMPKTNTLSPADLYEASDSVVALGNIYKCDRCDDWHANLAGGVILTEDGVVLTNHHVFVNDKAAAFGAITRDGKVFPVTEILASSKPNDIALARLEGTGFKPAAVTFDQPVGSNVTVISHPDRRYFTLTTGMVSRYFMQQQSPKQPRTRRMAITADYARGSSGCPVFNSQGAVVGLVSTTSSIYYNQKTGEQKNLQMVIKSCIPTSLLKGLFEEPDEQTEQRAALENAADLKTGDASS